MKFLVRTGGGFYFCLLFYIFFLARRRPHPTLFRHIEPVNLIPFKNRLAGIAIYGTLSANDKLQLLLDLFGNIALFIPLPFFLVFIFKIKSFSKIILFAFILSTCVEITQFILSVGVADIDDVIFNTLGACIGVFMLAIIKRLHQNAAIDV